MRVLNHIAIFLLAAVIAVPLFRKLKLGAVLGYLVAGIAIGPFGLGLMHWWRGLASPKCSPQPRSW